MALTAYEAAVAAKPKEKITLRHGAARPRIDAPTDGPLPRVAGRSAQIEECRADIAGAGSSGRSGASRAAGSSFRSPREGGGRRWPAVGRPRTCARLDPRSGPRPDAWPGRWAVPVLDWAGRARTIPAFSGNGVPDLLDEARWALSSRRDQTLLSGHAKALWLSVTFGILSKKRRAPPTPGST
jgi:hypothetical protein